MSDYGASIILTKKDKTALTPAEISRVEQEFDKIKTEHEFEDSDGDDLLFQVDQISNRADMLQVVLTMYWDDDHENFDGAKEHDLEAAEEIAVLIAPALGEAFEIKPDFDTW